MSKAIKIPVQKLTQQHLIELEARELIHTLKAPAIIASAPEKDADTAIYTGQEKFGSHMLLCVRKNETAITLYVHSDNEDLIFLKPKASNYKPLYLIIALHKEDAFTQKARDGLLSSKDILALEIEYNNPELLFFTIRAGTPHCEITAPGDGEAPVFYVTEPSKLDMYAVDAGSYNFKISH